MLSFHELVHVNKDKFDNANRRIFVTVFNHCDKNISYKNPMSSFRKQNY
jgi:hypothetical protein